MSTFAQLVKLNLSRPRKPILLLAAVLFLVLSVLLEIFARLPAVQSQLPYQAYGINHAQLETQLKVLDEFVQHNGAPDCFLFGNSQAFREINTNAFEAAYEQASGEDVLCYNFSVTGSQIATTSAFNKMLVEKYHPRLVVIATSFLDYTEGRDKQNDERFKESEWLKYHAGETSISGWLMEASYAWRALTYLSYAAPFGMNFEAVTHEAAQWDTELAPNGNAISKDFINPLAPAEDGFVKKMRAEFGNFGISENNFSALEEVVAFDQSQGAQVILVEMMYHPALLDLNDSRGNPRADRARILDLIARVNAQLDALAQQRGIVYIHFDSSLPIPEKGWFDLYHLNNNGAKVFSAWLGEQVAGWVIANPMTGAFLKSNFMQEKSINHREHGVHTLSRCSYGRDF